MLHSICQQIWKTQQWPQDWKMSVFIPLPKKGNAKECSNYHTIALISHASKVMFKILQAKLQQYVNRELPDVQAGFRRGRGTRDQIANICWSMDAIPRRPSYSASFSTHSLYISVIKYVFFQRHWRRPPTFESPWIHRGWTLASGARTGYSKVSSSEQRLPPEHSVAPPRVFNHSPQSNFGYSPSVEFLGWLGPHSWCCRPPCRIERLSRSGKCWRV